MACVAYVGVPGSGKSLHVMDDIYFACLRKSSLVMTNFDVAWPRHKRCSTARLRSGELEASEVLDEVRRWRDAGNRVRHEGQILLVIDEAQIPFSNREWNKKGRDEWVRLFIQHRKLGMRIVLVVQDMGMLDKQIRANVELVGSHMLVNHYGWFGRILNVLLLGRPLSMCVLRLPFFGSSKASIIGREVTLGRKRLYRMYDTHAMFSDDLDIGDLWA